MTSATAAASLLANAFTDRASFAKFFEQLQKLERAMGTWLVGYEDSKSSAPRTYSGLEGNDNTVSPQNIDSPYRQVFRSRATVGPDFETVLGTHEL